MIIEPQFELTGLDTSYSNTNQDKTQLYGKNKDKTIGNTGSSSGNRDIF